MASTPRTHVRVAMGLVALIPILAACTSAEEPTPTASSTPSSQTVTTEVVESSTSSSSTTRSAEPSTTSTVPEDGLSKDVAKVYQDFKSLAPLELFKQFDTCDPNGVENSSACTGTEVGQFQFFDNTAKAASTTQLLTELRSSRVVEDTGSKIVGWTTIGTMSIVTVVDNDNGLVLQQMVSSDRIDPEERIYELGLVDEPENSDSDEEEPTETTTAKN